jgi:hypothetical protein
MPDMPRVLPERPQLSGFLFGRPGNSAGILEVRDRRALRRSVVIPDDRLGRRQVRRQRPRKRHADTAWHDHHGLVAGPHRMGRLMAIMVSMLLGPVMGPILGG